jgi:plasmid stabilization system protein ParE
MDGVGLIPSTPNGFSPGRVKNTREYFVRTYPYFIVYEVTATRIYLLRVLHVRREYP